MRWIFDHGTVCKLRARPRADMRQVFSGAGGNVITGAVLSTCVPRSNPTRFAYEEWTNGRGRSSWDQIALVAAILGPRTIDMHMRVRLPACVSPAAAMRCAMHVTRRYRSMVRPAPRARMRHRRREGSISPCRTCADGALGRTWLAIREKSAGARVAAGAIGGRGARAKTTGASRSTMGLQYRRSKTRWTQ